MVPSAAYDSREELVSAIYLGQREYTLLLGRVVDENLELSEAHLQENARNQELETELGKEVRTMVTSIDCSELRDGGTEILLRVTRGRGKWWAVGVNEEVISAVENSFHERIRNGLLWLVTFAGGRIDFGRTKHEFYLSVREEMAAEALNGILGCPYSGRFGAVLALLHLLRGASEQPCRACLLHIASEDYGVPRRLPLDDARAARRSVGGPRARR